MKKIITSILFLLLIFAGEANAQSIEKMIDGIVITSNRQSGGHQKLKLKVWSDSVIEVRATSEEEFSEKESLFITGKISYEPDWQLKDDEKNIILSTKRISVVIEKSDLNISFVKNNKELLLAENNRTLEKAVLVDEECYHVKQSFEYSPGETLYGLGSFQDSDLPLNGKKRILLQKNREDVVPVIISTNNYGLIWDNYSYSEFNDTRDGYYLWSEVADEINYFFVYGQNIDEIVSAYRKLTGKAPMYPKNFYGYIQSKQKYNTQDEIVSIVKGFRERRFPLDVIVQDWFYWNDGQWGQKSFNRSNYPDPEKMVNDIHNMNTKIIISIWPNMSKGTPNQIELSKINGLFTDNEHLNILKPEAREMYWRQTNDSLFSIGIDGWWADCSEGYDSDWDSPYFKLSDTKVNRVNSLHLKTMMNSGRYINAYALLHTKGLYEGQRSVTSQKRVFILTRSSFAGMQKYAASYWTGDVSANWEEFRMQITAGLNFCMTGIPYWTTDIAGYFIKHEPGWWFSNGVFEKGQEDEGFKELYTRWFQFASFCPLFRAHGADFPREPWEFGSPESRTYKTLLKFTQLRYRLMPYIYSLAWKVTDQDYTIMRALPFDFMNDKAVYAIGDEYLFGPSFLVCPVTKPVYYLPNNIKMDTKDYTRDVYLPEGAEWFDFWTGRKYKGGQTLKADASFETMPLFIKAGSIIPFGPFIQYAGEASDPIELRIYPGADGEFTLYEDENDNYNYEKGIYSLIQFKWNDETQELTIAKRVGEYPGMLKHRNFKVVVVNDANGTDVGLCQSPDKIVKYDGEETLVNLK